MTVQLSYQNVLLFPPTVPSKIQSSGVAIQTFANWLTQTNVTTNVKKVQI